MVIIIELLKFVVRLFGTMALSGFIYIFWYVTVDVFRMKNYRWGLACLLLSIFITIFVGSFIAEIWGYDL